MTRKVLIRFMMLALIYPRVETSVWGRRPMIPGGGSVDRLMPTLPRLGWTKPTWIKIQLPWANKRSTLIAVASAFEAVGPDFKSERLIRACESFLVIQRGMGPSMRAVADHFERNIKMAQEAYDVNPNARATLRSFLEDEVRCGLHDPVKGTLSYPSGACALLWMRRSIAFHTEMFDAFVDEVAVETPSPARESTPAPETGRTHPSPPSPVSSPPPSSPPSSPPKESRADASTSTAAQAPVIDPKKGKALVDEDGRAPSRAALVAYRRSLERYHGYLLQHAYRIGLSRSMPPTGPFLAKLSNHDHNPHPRQVLARKRREAEVAFAHAAAAATHDVSHALSLAAAEVEARIPPPPPLPATPSFADDGGANGDASGDASGKKGNLKNNLKNNKSKSAPHSHHQQAVYQQAVAAAKGAQRAASEAADRASAMAAKATSLAAQEAARRDAELAKEQGACVRDMRVLVGTWRPVVLRWEKVYQELNLEDSSKA